MNFLRLKQLIADWIRKKYPLEIIFMLYKQGEWINYPLMISPIPSILKDNKFWRAKTPKEFQKMHNYIVRKGLLSAKSIDELLIHIQKPYKLNVIYLIRNLIDKKELGKLIGNNWSMVEFPHQHKKGELKKLFEMSDKNSLMDEEERKKFDELPEVVTIYRGCTTKGKRGFSWTLSKEKAGWFAKRFETIWGKGKVYKSKIHKENIYAYVRGREEDEVVVNPDELIEIEEVEDGKNKT